MRHASLVVALAFAFLSGACSDRGNISNQDAGNQEDATAQFDVNNQQDTLQVDTAPQADAPPANYDSGQSLVKCGNTFCNLANNEECCVTGTTVDCQAAGTCAGYGTLNCDGPEDCFSASAPICCGTIGGSGGGTSCMSTCTGSGAMTLCHSDGDCGVSQKCCGSLALGGLNITYCLAEADCQSGPTDGVPCGTGVTCHSPDACCMTFSGGSCGTAASCTAGLPLLCDGPEDCQQDGGTAQLCCADVIYSGGISGGSSCVTTCSPVGIIGGVMCHSNSDCQSPKTCKTAGYGGFTFHLCQN